MLRAFRATAPAELQELLRDPPAAAAALAGHAAAGAGRQRPAPACRPALARDIAASIVAAQQRGEQRAITFYTQQAETIRLVEEQLAAAARDSPPAQEGAAAHRTDAEQDCARGEDAMRIARYRNTRYWAVIDTEGTLVCLCVYRKGALEVVRRLQARTTA